MAPTIATSNQSVPKSIMREILRNTQVELNQYMEESSLDISSGPGNETQAFLWSPESPTVEKEAEPSVLRLLYGGTIFQFGGRRPLLI